MAEDKTILKYVKMNTNAFDLTKSYEYSAGFDIKRCHKRY